MSKYGSCELFHKFALSNIYQNKFPKNTNCEKLPKLGLPFIYQNIPRASSQPCESANLLALEQSHCLKRDLINYQYNNIISNKN